MPASGLNHVSISAADLDDSIRFYQDLFGMEPLPTPNFGFPVQWLRLGPNQLHLFKREGAVPTYHHLAITVDDFEQVYEQAKQRGAFDRTTFGHHLYALPGDVAQLYLRDPGGNLVEVDIPGAHVFPQSEENLRATLFHGTEPQLLPPNSKSARVSVEADLVVALVPATTGLVKADPDAFRLGEHADRLAPILAAIAGELEPSPG